VGAITLESVAVTNLDQTPLEALDENNRFDVVAIQTIKQEVEDRQTETARIEQENQVRREENRLKADLEIKQREEETETQALEVAKRLEFAQEEQRKSIATNRAEQEREIEAHKLEQQQKAKANGEEASIAAKNQADSKVLVSDAILALLESLPEVTTELMKPAERIESIRVLDLGGGGNGNGSNGMNRILSSIVNAGAAVPLLKEIVGFSGLDTERIAQTIRDYASSAVVNAQSDSAESTDAD
jgi:uncharacterized membrane protein YqiK